MLWEMKCLHSHPWTLWIHTLDVCNVGLLARKASISIPESNLHFVSTSDFQSEVGEVFGEIGGELPAKFGRRFSSFFCRENRQKHFPPKFHREFHHQTSLRGSGLWRALHFGSFVEVVSLGKLTKIQILHEPRVGYTPRGSCKNTLLRRVHRRFSNSKYFLEGALDAQIAGDFKSNPLAIWNRSSFELLRFQLRIFRTIVKPLWRLPPSEAKNPRVEHQHFPNKESSP